MNSVFKSCINFKQTVSHFVIDKVTDFSAMLKKSGFNQDISNWTVPANSLMFNMFTGATNFDQNLCSWGFLPGAGTDVADMFKDTSFPFQIDPYLAGMPPGPFCPFCENTSVPVEYLSGCLVALSVSCKIRFV